LGIFEAKFMFILITWFFENLYNIVRELQFFSEIIVFALGQVISVLM